MAASSALVYIAAAAAVAGAGVTAYSSVKQGEDAARAAAFEKQQRKIQEERTRTAAMQSEAHRREELNDSLGTIHAIRAGRGVAFGSPTGMALLTSEIEGEQSNIITERANYLTSADGFRLAAEEAGRRRRSSLLSGYLGAGQAVAGGVSSAYSMFRPTTGTTTATARTG